VKQEQYQYPVLKSKALNHVLQLDIINMDTLQNNALTEVVLDLQGTDDLGIIESVSLFRVMDSIAFLGPDSELFAKNDKVTSKMSLKGNIDLDKGHNYFWLSYTSKDNAPIGKNVGGICTKVLTTKGTVKVMALERPKTLRTGIAVRKQFDDNVHTFRIPGLVTTNSGTLLACYDIRYGSARDLQGNIDIGISRSTDGGNNWEPMQIAMDMGEWGGLPQKFNGVSDAALLVDRSNNTVFVAGLWMHGVIDKNGKWTEGLTEQSGDWNHQWKNKGSQPGFGVRETSQFLIAKSLDDGKTWEEPVNITKMCKKEEWWLFAPAPGKGITLEDGTLVFPTQGRDKNGVPFSNITYSKDGGISWETSEPAYSNTTECAVVQLEDGSLMLNMRDNVNRKNKGNNNGRAIAVTNDLGKNWTEHATSHNALIEPVCMASLYRHVYWNGKGEGINMLFFSNPNSKDKRHKQTIKVSLDNGGTWPEKYWVELDGGQGAGYSCLTSVNNGTIGILYEGSQAQMTFQLLSIRDMLDL
jgi:sialidase-1